MNASKSIDANKLIMMSSNSSKVFNHWPGILFATLLLTLGGCATTVQPFPVTCPQDFPVKDRESPEFKKYFSILPPKGGNWCIDKSTSVAIVYSTGSMMGKLINTVPKREDFSHTVFVFAVPLEFKETDVSTLGSIDKALEKWAQGKEKTQIKDDASWYVELTDSQRDKRFKLVRFESHADSKFKNNCIRWESSQEERDNPKFPGSLMKLNNAGLLCKHPSSENKLIHLYFTERYLAEREDLQYSNRVRQEAERTFQSFEFADIK